MNNFIVCLDVWQGEFSENHVARYILPLNEALTLASHELTEGNLINLRKEINWGKFENFDLRIGVK